MIGIFFSGTGNTKHCAEKFLSVYDPSSKCLSIEDKDAISHIKQNKDILLAYPIYFSNLPKILSDFINNNKEIWRGKNIFIISTMALFSGDGSGCSARLLKKYGANILGGLHLKMPDCIGDVKILKKPLHLDKQTVKKTEEKINNAVNRLKNNTPTKEGLNLLYQGAGLLGQRLWFYNKTKEYTDKLKIDDKKCIGCGKCVVLCPMKNIEIKSSKAFSKNKCTMCYRCISNCPVKAITLIGKRVIVQSKIENYV